MHQTGCNAKNDIEHRRDRAIQSREEEKGEADCTNDTEAIGVSLCGAGGDVPVRIVSRYRWIGKIRRERRRTT